ncbi:hypothetical protein [Kibdelosporangium aridum]|uniref:hypothetical protein n=1 Tax=Kibdelosporangium aridum TaxID=2030 RepID=UPI0035E7F7B0
MSWHANFHTVAALLVFGSLIPATVAFARRFVVRRRAPVQRPLEQRDLTAERLGASVALVANPVQLRQVFGSRSFQRTASLASCPSLSAE